MSDGEFIFACFTILWAYLTDPESIKSVPNWERVIATSKMVVAICIGAAIAMVAVAWMAICDGRQEKRRKSTPSAL